MGIKEFSKFWHLQENGYSLAIYRIGFGLLMCLSLLRFIAKGWVAQCYLEPSLHFTYQYFHWVQPILSPAWAMYAIVGFTLLAALAMSLGFLYRIGAILFFLLFSYLELIEQSWYLNHYYFISIIAFLLCFFPANRRFSVKAMRSNGPPKKISIRYSFALKLQISLVYFFAGIAKLTPDWIIEALPLRIWLKVKVDLPIIGDLLAYDWSAYLFSYTGAAYDLLIPFFLWNRKTRPLALLAVFVFHVTTSILFQIGMFPWIMILGSLIFITDDEWKKLLQIVKVVPFNGLENTSLPNKLRWPTALTVILCLHFGLQILLPLRKFAYDENHHWTERHYRFAWNVMLTEKSGYTLFKVVDRSKGTTYVEYPSDYLTPIQDKQMSYQPDMLWQFGQHLEQVYFSKGINDVEVYVESWVSYNKRPSQLYLPKTLNLLALNEDEIYDFVLPLAQ